MLPAALPGILYRPWPDVEGTAAVVMLSIGSGCEVVRMRAEGPDPWAPGALATDPLDGRRNSWTRLSVEGVWRTRASPCDVARGGYARFSPDVAAAKGA